MTVMAGAIVSPALPGMSRHFAGHPEVWIKLVLTLPALMIALFGTVMGYLADRFGRKRLLLAMLLLYGVAGFGGYLIDDFALLLASRALLGVAVAGTMSVSTTLIGDYFRAEERARFLGMQGSFMALGGLVFLNLGGALAEWSWRGPFLVYLAGIALMPFAWTILFEPDRGPFGEPDGGDPPAVIDRLPTAVIFLVGLIGMLLFYMVPAQLPFLLTQRFGASSLAVGLAVSAATLTAASTSLAYGRIARRFSPMSLYVLAFLLVTAGFAVVGTSASYGATTAGVAVSGVGFGLFMPNGTVWLMRITPERARGRVVGGFTSMLFFGQFLSPLAVAPLALWLASLRQAYVAAALAAAALAALLAVLGATVLRTPQRV